MSEILLAVALVNGSPEFNSLENYIAMYLKDSATENDITFLLESIFFFYYHILFFGKLKIVRYNYRTLLCYFQRRNNTDQILTTHFRHDTSNPRIGCRSQKNAQQEGSELYQAQPAEYKLFGLNGAIL